MQHGTYGYVMEAWDSRQRPMRHLDGWSDRDGEMQHLGLRCSSYMGTSSRSGWHPVHGTRSWETCTETCEDIYIGDSIRCMDISASGMGRLTSVQRAMHTMERCHGNYVCGLSSDVSTNMHLTLFNFSLS